MEIRKDKEYIEEFITSGGNIAILCGDKGNDAIGSAIAFAQYIEETWGKKATVICPFNMDGISADLLEQRQIANNFDPKTLRITINYDGTNVETVDWKDLGDALQLEIKPVGREFDMSRIKYDTDGIVYDRIIMVGIPSLDALGDTYAKNKSEIDSARILNLDNSRENTKYGKINLTDNKVESISGLLLRKFGEWEYTPSKSAAKALLLGITG